MSIHTSPWPSVGFCCIRLSPAWWRAPRKPESYRCVRNAGKIEHLRELGRADHPGNLVHVLCGTFRRPGDSEEPAYGVGTVVHDVDVALATLVVLGPLGNYLGEGVGILLEYLNIYASWLVPMLVGAFTPLMVMTGMHYGLIPIGINMLASSGYDTVAGPGMESTAPDIAQGGASLAVAFKAKDADVKRLASSVWLTAVLGITGRPCTGSTCATNDL